MAEKKDEIILLTKKHILSAMHNEMYNTLVRQEVDLEMNEMLQISDVDPKVADGRRQTIRTLKENTENMRKCLKIIREKLVEEDEGESKN